VEVSILPDLDVVLEDLRLCAGVEVVERLLIRLCDRSLLSRGNGTRLLSRCRPPLPYAVLLGCSAYNCAIVDEDDLAVGMLPLRLSQLWA